MQAGEGKEVTWTWFASRNEHPSLFHSLVLIHRESCMGTRFPTFAFVVLILGLLWLAVEMHWITIPIPWLPLILVVVDAGWIVNNYMHG